MHADEALERYLRMQQSCNLWGARGGQPQNGVHVGHAGKGISEWCRVSDVHNGNYTGFLHRAKPSEDAEPSEVKDVEPMHLSSHSPSLASMSASPMQVEQKA